MPNISVIEQRTMSGFPVKFARVMFHQRLLPIISATVSQSRTPTDTPLLLIVNISSKTLQVLF